MTEIDLATIIAIAAPVTVALLLIVINTLLEPMHDKRDKRRD